MQSRLLDRVKRQEVSCYWGWIRKRKLSLGQKRRTGRRNREEEAEWQDGQRPSSAMRSG